MVKVFHRTSFLVNDNVIHVFFKLAARKTYDSITNLRTGLAMEIGVPASAKRNSQALRYYR